MTVPRPATPRLDGDATPPPGGADTSPWRGDVTRRAARALVRDADGRCLMVRVCDPTDPGQGTWWELPGGGVEPVDEDDTARTCAREVAEETGWRIEVGAAIATRRVRYRFRGRTVLQHETMHPATVDTRGGPGPTRRDVGEADALLDIAWLTPAALADGRRVDPAPLPALVADLDARDAAAPRRLPDVDVTGWSDAAPDPRPLLPDRRRTDGGAAGCDATP